MVNGRLTAPKAALFLAPYLPAKGALPQALLRYCAKTGRFLQMAVGTIPPGESRAHSGTIRRIHAMIRPLLLGSAVIALIAVPAISQQKTVKIGFVSSF